LAEETNFFNESSVMNKKAGAIAGALILLSLICASCTIPTGGLEVGRKAPSFSLVDLHGRQVTLDQYKGRVVMLDFWATWCAPCRQSMPALENLEKEFHEDLTLLAINLGESPEKVRSYVKLKNIQSMVLLDVDGSVGQAYRSDSIPMQVLVDQQGVVRHVQIGFAPVVQQQLRAEISKLLRG
jgi:thiol-disulfide isomerase/thioredoxin